jgi:hypothetical protein
LNLCSLFLKIKYGISDKTDNVQSKSRGRSKEKVAKTGTECCNALNY